MYVYLFTSTLHFIAHTHTREGNLFPSIVSNVYNSSFRIRLLEPSKLESKENESIISTFHVNYSIAFARFLHGWKWFTTRIDTKGHSTLTIEILFPIEY